MDGQNILKKSRDQVSLLKQSLETFNYTDLNAYKFFQFYKNGNELEVKQFEDQERNQIATNLFRFFIDILFCKY